MLTLVSLLLFSLSSQVAASPCVAFDANWNLYAFGFNGKDFNAGTSDTWASGTASDATASGRPPFDGTNTTCYLSQFSNAIYVMNGNASDPNAVHIYNPGGKSWTTQTTSGGPNGFSTILDHDTNVFYALSDAGELWFLDFTNLTTTALPATIPWTDVEKAGFDTTNYSPVMALANNHVHFINVPGVAAGSADIFVIHFSFFQPTPQPYGNFPAQHGQTASIFMPANDGLAFAYIPDDGSATYIIDVVSNTTTTMAGPSAKDSSASYFASDAAIVQLTSSGDVNFIPYTNSSADSSASWSTVKNLVSVAPTSSAGSATGTASGSKSSATSGSSSGSGSGSSSSNDARKSSGAVLGMMAALSLGSIAIFLS
ncbi:hypothetical protein BDP27DRAFT_815887 [Rhodocollybia butyracea]|uniref:Uncharacterized protein n=1 Tax=Rhodocollybia butyracea TaxID=206335 RepID=A0A9P5U767_9AGAR|nr:hypothetical protein BDP27DRAFT_815887 [Rhodocollybia butyracea]